MEKFSSTEELEELKDAVEKYLSRRGDDNDSLRPYLACVRRELRQSTEES